MEKILPERFREFRLKVGLTQEEMASMLGIGGKYVGMIERGKKDLDAESSLGKLFLILEESPLYGAGAPSCLREDQQADENKKNDRQNTRMIPVVSWAHAGDAESYEELPKDWQDMVPTECPDEDAFSVILNGDSMEPRFYERDQLILMPNKRPLNGGLVVCRFKNDGIIFRQIEVIRDKIRLVPINTRYVPTEHTEEDFAWIYPLWGMYRQLWK